MEYRKKEKTVVIRLDENEELIQSIKIACEKANIQEAFVSGIGFSDYMKLRIFDKKNNRFLFKEITGSHEIVSITGNVFRAETELFPHIHIVAANEKCELVGGHLIEANIAATAEIVLQLSDIPIKRGYSDENHLGKMRFIGMEGYIKDVNCK